MHKCCLVEHCVMTAQECSEAELGAAPVPAIPVVSDRVIGTVADPVGQRAILLDLLGVARLLTERLDGSHFL